MPYGWEGNQSLASHWPYAKCSYGLIGGAAHLPTFLKRVWSALPLPFSLMLVNWSFCGLLVS